MKKFTKIALVIMIAAAFVGCKSKKEVTQNYGPKEPVQGPVVTTPCAEQSKDDAEYYRDFGVGTNVNLQSSRNAALQAAKQMIHERLGGLVKGLTSDYIRTVAGQTPSDKVQRIVETGTDQVIEKMLNDAEKICETTIHLDNGEYQTFYAIQISKKELAKKTAEILSEQEELEIEFNREQFRKYAENRMTEMKKL